MRKLLLFILAFLIKQDLSAQNLKVIDSLSDRLHTTTGRQKVECFYNLAWEYKYSDFGKAEDYVLEAIELAKEVDDQQGLGQSFYHYGAILSINQNIEDGLKYLHKSQEVFSNIKDLTGQGKALSGLALTYDNKGDLLKSEEYYHQAINIFVKLKDSVALSTVYDNLSGLLTNMSRYDEGLEHALKGLEIRKALNSSLLPSSYLNVGLLLYKLGDYESAVEKYFIGIEIADRQGSARDVSLIHSNLANLYKRLKRYKEAQKSFDISLDYQLSHEQWLNASRTYNNIGALLGTQNLYDEALIYYLKSLELKEKIGSTNQLWVVLGNIGDAYSRKHQFDKSNTYLKRALQSAQNNQSEEGIGTALLKMAIAKSRQEQWDSARYYADKAWVHKMNARNLTDLKNSALTISDICEGQKDIMAALQWHRTYVKYSDSIIHEHTINKFTEIIGGYEINKAERELRLKDQEIEILNQNKKLALVNSDLQKKRQSELILTLLLTIVGAIAIFTVQRAWSLRRQKALALEREEAKHKLSIEKLEKTALNREVQQFARQLASKNVLLEDLKKEIERIEQDEKDLDFLHIFKLVELNIGSDEDWEAFKSHFNKVHASFLKNLRSRFPNLSTYEIRLAALLKLKMTNKEIAGILGIANDSVKKAKQRLRKKLSLQADQLLRDFLEGI